MFRNWKYTQQVIVPKDCTPKYLFITLAPKIWKIWKTWNCFSYFSINDFPRAGNQCTPTFSKFHKVKMAIWIFLICKVFQFSVIIVFFVWPMAVFRYFQNYCEISLLKKIIQPSCFTLLTVKCSVRFIYKHLFIVLIQFWLSGNTIILLLLS